jgi:hypothetical protein
MKIVMALSFALLWVVGGEAALAGEAGSAAVPSRQGPPDFTFVTAPDGGRCVTGSALTAGAGAAAPGGDWAPLTGCGCIQGSYDSTGWIDFIGAGATSCEQVQQACLAYAHGQIPPCEHGLCYGPYDAASQCGTVTCGGQVCGYRVYCNVWWSCRVCDW